jgi:hypothetical protein
MRKRHFLDGPLVARYLDELVVAGGEGYRLNGQTLRETDGKAMRLWRQGSHPTLWALDRVMVRYGLHVNDFFIWCGDRNPWLGEVPWYEREADRVV